MSIYVRCKRDTKTWFVHCESHDSVKTVVDEIASVEGLPGEDILLYREDESPLSPNEELGAQGVKSSNLIYVVYKQGDGTWEPILVKKPVYVKDDGSAAPTPGGNGSSSSSSRAADPSAPAAPGGFFPSPPPYPYK